jgi:hypothetical protein
MGVDLRLEPYAKMFEEEKPALRIIDAFCFTDIDRLLGRLGLSLHDCPVIDNEGRLPHEAALRLLYQVGTHEVPPDVTADARFDLMDKRDKLLLLLQRYRDWYEHPERIPVQMGEFVGTVPGMAGRIRSYLDEHPDVRTHLVLQP